MSYTVKDILRMEVAPALGCTEPAAIAMGGDPGLGLEVLDTIDRSIVESAQKFIAGTAVQAALFSLQGVNVLATDGIIGASPEKTMQNVGILSTEGMIETDRIILKIMLEKQFSAYN